MCFWSILERLWACMGVRMSVFLREPVCMCAPVFIYDCVRLFVCACVFVLVSVSVSKYSVHFCVSMIKESIRIINNATIEQYLTFQKRYLHENSSSLESNLNSSTFRHFTCATWPPS